MTEIQIEAIMEIACDLCWYPTAISNQEWLDEKCEKCPLERKLREVLADEP